MQQNIFSTVFMTPKQLDAVFLPVIGGKVELTSEVSDLLYSSIELNTLQKDGDFFKILTSLKLA